MNGRLVFPLLVLLAGSTSVRPVPSAAADPPESAKEATPDAKKPTRAGHSYHGEAFNEGPRQKAYLMEGTGDVDFPATTEQPLARKFIDQGVGQLHGFWYFEAERSFRQAAALDPECAIAYWGMAMANINNEKRARGLIAEAVARKTGITEREAMYIDALDAYLKAGSKKNKERSEEMVKAYERILYKYPDDLEAKAFLALQLWWNRGRGIPIASHLAVDALLKQILAANPRHPCHHYIIHLWDYEKPEKALASAARCGQSAPAIAHMWHMPGHIYSRLKRYHDAAWQQEASARVDHAHMVRDRVLPDQIHNFAHNNEWLIRNLVHVGRTRDAVDLAKNMIELPRHPKYNTLAKRGSSHYGRLRLFETLSKFELWDELIALARTPYLEPTDKHGEQVKRLRHLGRAYFAIGDVENGKAQLAELERRLQSEREAQTAAVNKAVAAHLKKHRPAGPVEAARPGKDRAAGAPDKQLAKAGANARRPFETKIRPLEGAVNELQGRAAIARGDHKDGLALVRKAGGVDPLDVARIQFQAGETDEAEAAVRKQVKNNENEVLPLAALVELLRRSGKKTEAAEPFERLRKLASDADLDTPPLARLSPLAQELGLPEDWRISRTPPVGQASPLAPSAGQASPLAPPVGQASSLAPPEDGVQQASPAAGTSGDACPTTRPDLDALGPFRWHPYPAPDWTLRDVEGRPHALKEYRGRPVVVIFYLGYGCLHCAEQLKAFAPKTTEFAEAGISLVAISTDDEPALQNSLDGYKDGTFPFPLVANAGLDVFKAYRAYDDFEDQPLHGTFLIDAEGRVRWQDISYEPFMDAAFVLQEAQRLLAQ